MESAPGPQTTIDGRTYLYFGGTGYLGLQGHPEVLQAACDAARRLGVGSATSRLGVGTTPAVLAVERNAAAFFGLPAAVYLPSGYMTNHLLVLLLEGRFDLVLVDRFAHYSVREASRLAGRPVVEFEHCDAEDLSRRLREHLAPGARPLVLTDGVFAAQGAIAPLPAYCRVLGAYPGSILVVDDAHAIGVLGANGRGTLEHHGIARQGVNAVDPRGGPSGAPEVFMGGTLSKAIGGYGGIVPGSDEFVGWAKGTSSHYAGSSPPPCPVAGATAKALLLAADPERRARLSDNVSRVRTGLRRLGLDVPDSPVPVIPLHLGEAGHMRAIEQELIRRGIFVPYMSRYAGLPPEGVLRLAVFATHTPAMIERLLDELAKVL